MLSMYSKNLQIIDCLLKLTKSKKAVKNQANSKSATPLCLFAASLLTHRIQVNNNGDC